MLAVPTAAAEEDPFAALDAQLESQFQDLDQQLEAEYQAIDTAIEAAFQKLKSEAERSGAGMTRCSQPKAFGLTTAAICKRGVSSTRGGRIKDRAYR